MTKTITSFPVSWYSAFLESKLIAEQSKLETVKVMGAHSKINAISLNVKINKRKSVDICGYKLPINVQNFMQKRLSPSENIVESRRGATFLTHPLHVCVCVCVCAVCDGQVQHGSDSQAVQSTRWSTRLSAVSCQSVSTRLSLHCRHLLSLTSHLSNLPYCGPTFIVIVTSAIVHQFQ